MDPVVVVELIEHKTCQKTVDKFDKLQKVPSLLEISCL